MSAAARATIRPPALESSGDGAPERARLTLDQSGARIAARVMGKREGSLTLSQELSALRIGAPLHDDAGRPGHISRMALALEGDTPSLVVEVTWDGAAPAKPRLRDATIGYEDQSPYDRGRSSGWVRRDKPRVEEPVEERADPGTLVFKTEARDESEPAPPRVSQPWMEERGSEMALMSRDLRHRFVSALVILRDAMVAAFRALRG